MPVNPKEFLRVHEKGSRVTSSEMSWHSIRSKDCAVVAH